jgi:hypothetical protein
MLICAPLWGAKSSGSRSNVARTRRLCGHYELAVWAGWVGDRGMGLLGLEEPSPKAQVWRGVGRYIWRLY